MAFSFGSFLDAATSAASHLVALAASAAEGIHNFRAEHPMVAEAMALAEKDFPGLLIIEGAAQTVLSMAQTAVNAIRASAIGAGPAPVIPVNSPTTVQQVGVPPTPTPDILPSTTP